MSAPASARGPRGRGLGAAGALALAFTACHGASVTGTSAVAPCSLGVKPMPLAFIGPDVHLRVPCGGKAVGGLASVDETGNGITSWSVKLNGDSAFNASAALLTTCAGTPTVASVIFVAPAAALPGAAFDTVATVSADDDAFPTGTVNVHADVVQPNVTVDKPTVDFGDVPTGAIAKVRITFTDHFDLGVGLETPEPQAQLLPFGILPGPESPDSFSFDVTLAGHPGTYSMTSLWTAIPKTLASLPAACESTIPVLLRGRIVDVADGGADGGDGGDAS